MSGEKATTMHPEVAKNGRRPRWTETEDEFLVSLVRKGLSKKEIVQGYQKRFPTIERPDNGVLARLDQVKRLATLPVPEKKEERPVSVETRPIISVPETTPQKATNEICDILGPFTAEDRRRVLRAVSFLMDVGAESSSNHVSGNHVAPSESGTALRAVGRS